MADEKAEEKPTEKRWAVCDENGKFTGAEVVGMTKPDDARLIEVPMDADLRRKKFRAGDKKIIHDAAAPESYPDAPPHDEKIPDAGGKGDDKNN